MLTNEGRWILCSRAQRVDNCGIRLRVAEPDGEIARPALVADATNRAAFHLRVELRFGPSEQRDQIGIIEAVTHARKILFGRGGRIAIPRADELAIIAAVDAIADQRSQRL